MNELIATEEQMEEKTIARECAENFGGMVQWFRKHYELSAEEAAVKARGNPEEQTPLILQRHPSQVGWNDIGIVSQVDGEKAKELWESIQREALNELRTGHRAARAVQTTDNTPWQRAQFLAIRQELSEEWRPRTGIERQLIDTMAQAQAEHLRWMETLTRRTCLESWQEKQLAESGKWLKPRIDDAEAIEMAATMMDRSNKIFLRSLRALRDLRRYDRQIIVQNAGQVNVGGQQVNVCSEKAEAGKSTGCVLRFSQRRYKRRN